MIWSDVECQNKPVTLHTFLFLVVVNNFSYFNAAIHVHAHVLKAYSAVPHVLPSNTFDWFNLLSLSYCRKLDVAVDSQDYGNPKDHQDGFEVCVSLVLLLFSPQNDAYEWGNNWALPISHLSYLLSGQ